MCDIPADAGRGLGLFEDLKAHSGPADLANFLRSAAIKYYGCPIRAFLSSLVHSEWREDVERSRRAFETGISELHGVDMSSEVQRAAARFGLVAAAGELAAAFGITGWPEGEATAAAISCFTAWLDSRGGYGAMDDQTAIDQVRTIIEAHGHSRFEPFPTGKDQKILPNRLGYRYTDPEGRTEYWFLKAAFGEELRQQGRDLETVAKALRDAGFLKTTAAAANGKSRLQYRVPTPIPEFGNRPWVYAVLPSILGPEEEFQAAAE
jgi:putative DNA primase/helicase